MISTLTPRSSTITLTYTSNGRCQLADPGRTPTVLTSRRRIPAGPERSDFEEQVRSLAARCEAQGLSLVTVLGMR